MIGHYIISTSDYNYVITGQIRSDDGDNDVLLMKVNEIGDTVWLMSYEMPYSQSGYSVLETSKRI